MPEMDGITMLKKIRQDIWGMNVPVIILSNLSDSEHVFHSLDNGALDYLVKADWSLDAIVGHIAHRLDPKPKSES